MKHLFIAALLLGVVLQALPAQPHSQGLGFPDPDSVGMKNLGAGTAVEGGNMPTPMLLFPLGEGVPGRVYRSAYFKGELYVWQDISTSASFFGLLSRWNGTRWEVIDSIASDSQRALLFKEYAGGLYIRGHRKGVGGYRLYRWDGAAFETIPSELERGGWMYNGAEFQGHLYVGGTFRGLGGAAGADNIARWDGSQWHAVGGGLVDRERLSVIDSFDTRVHALAEFRGKLYVGGNFSHAGTLRTPYLAVWNGTSWEPAPEMPPGPVEHFCVMNDVMYMHCYDQGGPPPAPSPLLSVVRTWDGTTWRTLPAHPLVWVGDMRAFRGMLYMSGRTRNGAYSMVRWNGSEWDTFKGFDTYPVPTYDSLSYSACLVEYEGELIVGGHFRSFGGTVLNNVARVCIQGECDVLAVHRTVEADGVTIAPNPNTGLVRIDAPLRSGAVIAVLDMLGRTLFTVPVRDAAAQTVDLSSLAAGNYLLALPMVGGTTVHRVMLVK